MQINLGVVGHISFDGKTLEVYSDLMVPLFRASDVASLIEYSDGNTWKMLEMCEEDEKLNLPLVVAGQARKTSFVTERGLYNILSQSRKEIARKWRRVILEELIQLRNSQDRDIVEQFDIWDERMNSVYIDPETGIMMESITVQGGDVIQVEFASRYAEEAPGE